MEETEVPLRAPNAIQGQLQAALGSYAPPPSGAGAASAINAMKANLDLTSEPNPPRRGSNPARRPGSDRGYWRYGLG